MAHRRCFEAVDRSLGGVRGNKLSFGGVTMLAGGDFRRILPVVRNGNKAQILNAFIIRSPLWQHVERFRLSQNMRVLSEEVEFSIPRIDCCSVNCGLPFELRRRQFPIDLALQ